MINLSNFIALWCITTSIQQTVVAQYYAEPNYCITPNLQLGNCVALEKCSSLYNVSSQPTLSRNEKDFLLQSRCGETGPNIFVCCSDYIIQEISWYLRNGYSLTRVNQNAPQQQCSIKLNSQEATYGFLPLPPSRPVQNQHAVPQVSQLMPAPPHCGAPRIEARILGGTETAIGELPWMARIEVQNSYFERKHVCAGALINHRYVLTAAHCVIELKDWFVSGVRLGEWDTRTNPDSECFDGDCQHAPQAIDMDVDDPIIHPQYNAQETNQVNDIALLRLKQPVTFSEYVRPICLPISDELRAESFENSFMIVAGWGATHAEDNSKKLLKARLPVVDFKKCRNQYRHRKVILTESQMCAGGISGVDTCAGDSGGPLVSFRNNYYYVSGIVSIGLLNCGDDRLPGVYTRVNSHLDWIQQNMRE